MIKVRVSVPGDIPVQCELWKLAFGDIGAYVDNFYQTFYRPERMLVLEEDGAVRAMTAWFDTSFTVPEQGEWRAAYLYAVATHPDFRGKGLAGQLLAGADDYFRSLGIPAVTTVPAQPSLHNFFAANGFRECFTLSQHQIQLTAPAGQAPFALKMISAGEYGRMREQLLCGIPHVAYPQDAISYQQGCCKASGGGLYAAQTPRGLAILCAEGMENGSALVKELLGIPAAQAELLQWLPALLPSFSGLWREPGEEIPFGMLKWLQDDLHLHWNWSSKAYLGLAFD